MVQGGCKACAAGRRACLGAGVGAARPVDAHFLGDVQLLLQLAHDRHRPVLRLYDGHAAELRRTRSRCDNYARLRWSMRPGQGFLCPPTCKPQGDNSLVMRSLVGRQSQCIKERTP